MKNTSSFSVQLICSVLCVILMAYVTPALLAQTSIRNTAYGTNPDKSSELFTDPITVNTLAELRALAPDYIQGANEGSIVYKYTGNAVVTHMQDPYNVKYIQDETAAIEIFDRFGKIFNVEVGDKITNISGTLTNYYGMLEIFPIENCEVVSWGNTVSPILITLSQLDADNNNTLQAKVIQVNDVFYTQTGTFYIGVYYNLKENNIVYDSVVYTDNWAADYLGQVIPTTAVNIIGICNFKGGTGIQTRNRIVPMDNMFPTEISATTLDATNITSSSATLNGTSSFGYKIKQGFILTKPTGNDTIVLDNTITNLTYNVTDLPHATLFSYKAYCTTASGTVFGEEKQFATLFKQDGASNLIENIDDMLFLAQLIDDENCFEGQKFVLVNDITLPNTPNNIKAIGRYDDNVVNRRPFCGEFDGNNKKIYNVYIDYPNTPYQGLFGYAQNADIHNLGIVNITASGRNYTGGMIAYSENSKITDCYVSGGTLYALSYCGGLIGYQTPGTNSIITSCYNNNCSVSGNNYVGGLLGYSNQGTVRNSYVAAPVSGIEGTTGAIIGGALDVLFYNWWYNNSITDLPAIGENIITGKGDDEGISSEEMRKPEFVNTLNKGLVVPAWKMDYNPPINDGFPILIWQTQTTGIVNLEKESNINLYPNPVKDNFTIGFEDETKGQVFIYDMLGKVVNNQEINGDKTTISVVHLSKGVYIVRVVTEGKTFGVGKIIKQ